MSTTQCVNAFDGATNLSIMVWRHPIEGYGCRSKVLCLGCAGRPFGLITECVRADDDTVMYRPAGGIVRPDAPPSSAGPEERHSWRIDSAQGIAIELLQNC